MITPRQKEIRDYVNKVMTKSGVAPTEREIAKKFALSPSTVHEHLQHLAERGYIRKSTGKARGIHVTRMRSHLVKVPLLGTIAAGEPIEAVPNNEFISVPQQELPFGASVFALRVSGNSMVDEHINDGDIVLVQKQDDAENGQRVVALIDNAEATLKKIYRTKDHVRLEPANRLYEPIIVGKEHTVNVQGVVLGVVQEQQDVVAVADSAPTAPNSIRRERMPLNEVIVGDVVAQLKKLPDESCDVIIADPPYNIGKDFGNNIDKRSLEEYVAWSMEWINECIRVLKPSGTIFIYGFSEILAHLSVSIPLNKRWLIWHYTNKNVASLNFWQRSHEAIVCAWKDKPIFNRDDVREPYTEGFLQGAAGKVRKGTMGRFSKHGVETVYKAHEGGALPRDVIKVPALAGGAGMIERWFLCTTCDDVYEPRQLKQHAGHNIVKHPTQKPLELSKKLIASAAPSEDGVVLVPFVGTGSECLAACELGQSYVGFEINPDYVRIARKMIGGGHPPKKLR